jgi:hypothetical protein
MLGPACRPPAWHARPSFDRLRTRILLAIRYSLFAFFSHAPSAPRGNPEGCDGYAGAAWGSPGPGPNRPGRPRQAFLGTPSGSLRPCSGLLGRLAAPACGDLRVPGQMLWLPARPLQASRSHLEPIRGGRRLLRHCWRLAGNGCPTGLLDLEPSGLSFQAPAAAT